jgi:hypothetical protein
MISGAARRIRPRRDSLLIVSQSCLRLWSTTKVGRGGVDQAPDRCGRGSGAGVRFVGGRLRAVCFLDSAAAIVYIISILLYHSMIKLNACSFERN